MTPTPLMQRLDADFTEMFGYGRDAKPLFGTDVIPSNRDIERSEHAYFGEKK